MGHADPKSRLASVSLTFGAEISVTRLVDLLDFGPHFKAFGHNSYAQISHILRQLL